MRRQIFVFLAFIFLCLFLIFLDGRGFLRPVKKVAESLISPIQKSFYSIRARSSLKKEPTDFEEQLVEARHEIASLKTEVSTLKEENQAMRRLLGAPLPSSWQFLPAQVLGEEYGILRIDKGRKDGIEKMPTVVVDGVFVGKVIKVGEVFSLVQTFKSLDFKLGVVVKPEKGEGILGRGLLIFREGQLFLDKVLEEEKVAVGDFVLTSGEEGLAPDIPIGRLTKVTSEKGGLYKKAEVEPFFKEEYLETVFLIKVR